MTSPDWWPAPCSWPRSRSPPSCSWPGCSVCSCRGASSWSKRPPLSGPRPQKPPRWKNHPERKVGSAKARLGHGRESMTRTHRIGWLLQTIAAAALVLAACGSSPQTGTTNKGTIVVAGFNFPESSVLANLYGQALAHAGYTITYKTNLGTRKVVAPALESGQIDLYPGYAASELKYFNK